MTKENFNRIMAGLEEARRHAAGEDVPGMVIHRPKRAIEEPSADGREADANDPLDGWRVG